MHITTLLNERNIVLDLETTSKEELLDNLISLLGRGAKVLDQEKLREAVMEREALATTGVGEGFAIPHAKTDAVTDMVAAFAITREPVDFQSLDDQPVRIIFLLIGVESRVGTFLKILSRARLLMSSASFRKKLLQATSAKKIIEILREEEEHYFEAA